MPVERVHVGTRYSMNTDWPIENTVTREEPTHYRRRVTWLVTFGLCNGTADRGERFSTRREALAAARGQNNAAL